MSTHKKSFRMGILTLLILLITFGIYKTVTGRLLGNNRVVNTQDKGSYISKIVSASGSSSKSEKADMKSIKKALDREMHDMPGQWDIWIETLSSEMAISIRKNLDEDDILISASLIKLFIMGAVYDQIDAGILNEEEVWDLLNQMIIISDNDAANKLTILLGKGDESAGMAFVTEWAETIGCKGVKYNRLMLADNGLENCVTAESCGMILSQIYQEKCISAYASRQMLTILKNQQINNRIPARLPEGTITAHKTGDLTDLCSADVGIVFSPKEDYTVCIICNNPPHNSHPAEIIAHLSQLVYDLYNS